MELEFLKRGSAPCTAAEKRRHVLDSQASTISIARECELMGIARSTYYDAPTVRLNDAVLVVAIAGISEEFEAYGLRRVPAALRHQGIIANHKRIRRLMREEGLQPKLRRLFVVTTTSSHDGSIFPDLAKEMTPDGADQLWVADLAYVAIPGGFAYVAVILDAWSWHVVGYAIGRSIDARLGLAALRAAIAARQPPPACVHHSDRGSQYAAGTYRELLATHGFVGSMGPRGNSYDNAKARTFMITLKVEAVYPMTFKNFEDAATDLPHFIEEIYNKRRLHSAVGYLSPVRFEKQHARPPVKAAA